MIEKKYTLFIAEYTGTYTHTFVLYVVEDDEKYNEYIVDNPSSVVAVLEGHHENIGVDSFGKK